MKKAVGGKTRVDLAVDQIIQVILDRDMKAGDKLKGKVKKVIVIISQIIVVAFAAIMTKASFAMVLKQAAIGQTSPGLGIPMSVPYFSLVLGFALIAVVQAGELVSMIVHFNKPEDEMKEEVEA